MRDKGCARPVAGRLLHESFLTLHSCCVHNCAKLLYKVYFARSAVVFCDADKT